MPTNTSYIYPIPAPARRQGVEPRAHILYHENECHFVAPESDVERRLLDSGALHIGVVRFDSPPEPAPITTYGDPRRARAIPGRRWGSNRN